MIRTQKKAYGKQPQLIKNALDSLTSWQLQVDPVFCQLLVCSYFDEKILAKSNRFL